jgi:hypothetical protein
MIIRSMLKGCWNSGCLAFACNLALVTLSGCTANYQIPTRDITHPANAVPSPGAKPANEKWQGPWMEGSVGSSLRVTFYYGPWQCNRRWMTSCERECAAEGYALMGCMWLADIKYDWQAPVMPIKAGSRYALWHCCCNYLMPAPTSTHGVFNKQYPKCYEGGSPWNAVGPDLPYTDK